MLSAAYRFHGHGSLRYVYKNGQAVRSHIITIKYTKNPHRKNPRFAVVVSKKVHKSAVGRNRIRRRIYEVVREEIPHFAAPFDVAIMVFSSEVLTMSSADLRDMVRQIFTQAELYK
jgi:ribonuclease P protein component